MLNRKLRLLCGSVAPKAGSWADPSPPSPHALTFFTPEGPQIWANLGPLNLVALQSFALLRSLC